MLVRPYAFPKYYRMLVGEDAAVVYLFLHAIIITPSLCHRMACFTKNTRINDIDFHM